MDVADWGISPENMGENSNAEWKVVVAKGLSPQQNSFLYLF